MAKQPISNMPKAVSSSPDIRPYNPTFARLKAQQNASSNITSFVASPAPGHMEDIA